MYCAISKIFSANATGTRIIFSGLCFQHRGLPAPALAPPCLVLLFALLFFMFYLKDVTISIMAVFYSPYAFYPFYYLFFSCLFTGYHSPRLFCLRRASERRGRGGRPAVAPPPAHAYSCHLKHFFWVLIWQVNLNVYR